MSHLLLVDDDLDQRSIVCEWLEKAGHTVACAADTGEARICLEQQPLPDLIILDMIMTTVTEGFDFAGVLRGDSRWKRIPIILLTGMTRTEGFPGNFGSIMDKEWPVSLYLEKPVARERLLKEVTTLLKSQPC